MILWIFPWMLGVCLGLAGYLRYRHDQELLAAAGRLVPARVASGSVRQTITVPEGPSSRAL